MTTALPLQVALVEDDPPLRDATMQALSLEGAEVTVVERALTVLTARDGSFALDRGFVEIARSSALATFHDNGVFAAYVLLDGLWCCCDTGFPDSGFPWYPDVHRRLSSEGSP